MWSANLHGFNVLYCRRTSVVCIIFLTRQSVTQSVRFQPYQQAMHSALWGKAVRHFVRYKTGMVRCMKADQWLLWTKTPVLCPDLDSFLSRSCHLKRHCRKQIGGKSYNCVRCGNSDRSTFYQVAQGEAMCRMFPLLSTLWWRGAWIGQAWHNNLPEQSLEICVIKSSSATQLCHEDCWYCYNHLARWL